MTFDLYKYSDIIWDWNGTLFDDVELCAETMNELLEIESLPEISIEHYRNIFTFPVEEYYRKAGHTFSKNSFEFLGKEFMIRYEKGKSGCSLFPASARLLKMINSIQINQHILSAYEQNSLEAILTQFGINIYFNFIVGLDNIYAGGKLHLAEKLAAMINSNANKTSILLIGDTIHDYEVAKHIKADCILVASGHQSKNRLEQSGAVVIDNLSELIDLKISMEKN